MSSGSSPTCGQTGRTSGRWPAEAGPGGPLAWVGLALALAGALGPWIPHRTAALTVTGLELGEWAKFFPQVQGGSVRVVRELFVLPVVVVAVAAALLANADHRRLALRIAASVLGIGLALAVLPPYPSLRDAAYRGRLILALGGALAALASMAAGRLPRPVPRVLVAALALAGGALPLWQFARLHPLFVALYAAPVGLGWGAFLCPVGFAMLAIGSLWGVPLPSTLRRPAAQ
jgi:hypothetical protein